MDSRLPRRGVLLGVVASALAGRAASDPALASAVADASPDDIYAFPIRRMREIRVLVDSDTPEGVVTAEIDDLLRYLLLHYDGVPDAGEVRRMCEVPRSLLEPLTAGELERMAEALVPVAVMREMCRDRRLAFDPSASPAFDEFALRYAQVVLGVVPAAAPAAGEVMA